MPLIRRLTSLIVALLLALPASAWNYSGHCIVAEIACERLTPMARARVDRMIRITRITTASSRKEQRTRPKPKGDAGGNFVIVEPGRTLHSLWDDAAAPRDLSDEDVIRYAREITAEYPAGPPPSLDPTHWAAESFELDKSAVYTFGLETGSKEHPLKMPPGYEEKAKRIARQRVAVAGYRLAEVLNKYLQ